MQGCRAVAGVAQQGRRHSWWCSLAGSRAARHRQLDVNRGGWVRLQHAQSTTQPQRLHAPLSPSGLKVAPSRIGGSTTGVWGSGVAAGADAGAGAAAGAPAGANCCSVRSAACSGGTGGARHHAVRGQGGSTARCRSTASPPFPPPPARHPCAGPQPNHPHAAGRSAAELVIYPATQFACARTRPRKPARGPLAVAGATASAASSSTTCSRQAILADERRCMGVLQGRAHQGVLMPYIPLGVAVSTEPSSP